MGFGLPHKANVGEIIRVKGYGGILFLVQEWTEEVSHEKGASEPCVTYTCINIDNQKEIRIIFDADIESIVVTADRADEYIANRQKGTTSLPKEGAKKNEVAQVRIDLGEFIRKFQEEQKQKAKEAPTKKNDNNKPRSPWAKEREEKRKAYEYIDFLLEHYADLISMQQVMPHDEQIAAEIELIKVEFMEKTGEKIIQDGKFS